jgi:hypothetical protein
VLDFGFLQRRMKSTIFRVVTPFSLVKSTDMSEGNIASTTPCRLLIAGFLLDLPFDFKTEAKRSSETSVDFCRATWLCNTEAGALLLQMSDLYDARGHGYLVQVLHGFCQHLNVSGGGV